MRASAELFFALRTVEGPMPIRHSDAKRPYPRKWLVRGLRAVCRPLGHRHRVRFLGVASIGPPTASQSVHSTTSRFHGPYRKMPVTRGRSHSTSSHSAVLRWRCFRASFGTWRDRKTGTAVRWGQRQVASAANPGCATPRTMSPLPSYEVCYPPCPGHKCRTAAVQFAVSSAAQGNLR
jgi:hypothetical protein